MRYSASGTMSFPRKRKSKEIDRKGALGILDPCLRRDDIRGSRDDIEGNRDDIRGNRYDIKGSRDVQLLGGQ